MVPRISVDSREFAYTIDVDIKLTIEPEQNNKLPFLDLCMHVLDDASTKLNTIYRKPTHTEQYLDFLSHHPLTHKRSVVRTLTEGANQYVTTDENRKAELAHIHVREALLTETLL